MNEKDILQRAVLQDLEGESKIFDKETNSYYRLMIIRSLEARLRQADKDVREYYNTLKNEILSFQKNGVQLSPRFSFKHETFKDNRNAGFVLSIRGKTLCINFALPISYFEGKGMNVEDVSEFVMFKETPSMIRIRSSKDLEDALNVINDYMYGISYQKGFCFEMDYVSEFTYLDTDTLVKKGLIKVDIEPCEGEEENVTTFESSKEQIKITHQDFKRTEHEIVSDNRFNIEFHRSFLSKMIQTDMDTKYFYSLIKNELMSYKGIKSHYYWGDETFRAHSTVQAKMAFNGKTLCLYLNLDTKQFDGTKYVVENQSHRKKFACVPLVYRIRNYKKARYACDLIKMSMEKAGLKKSKKFVPASYKDLLVSRSDKKLLEEGLIRRVATNK